MISEKKKSLGAEEQNSRGKEYVNQKNQIFQDLHVIKLKSGHFLM